MSFLVHSRRWCRRRSSHAVPLPVDARREIWEHVNYLVEELRDVPLLLGIPLTLRVILVIPTNDHLCIAPATLLVPQDATKQYVTAQRTQMVRKALLLLVGIETVND